MKDNPQDRDLWHPDVGAPLVSRAENQRVRELLKRHLQQRVSGALEDAVDDDGLLTEKLFGHERKKFARDWVALAGKLGLKKPGEQLRTPLAGEDPIERQVDAGHTRLRQFLFGHNEYEWVLVGIEAVICDRAGLALPPAAYRTQASLPI